MDLDEVWRQFDQQDVDPRWRFLGVLEFAPTPARVGGCTSRPDTRTRGTRTRHPNDPDGESGSGIELTLEVSEQGNWAIETLQSLLALDLLLATGRFPNLRSLSVNDRVPLGGPINGSPACAIRNVIVAAPERGPAAFALPSGRVRLVGFTGVTDAELEFAKHAGTAELIARLREAGHHPVTDAQRGSLF